ncbi:ShlB/FhaC/HecB family hemolysin secretion/activation protein [Aetokthonos hydrillicola]|uniref:ShlB/FhaC/HecB family hemolysin secretion/activation protein n=1 Tax=Aetokthonos hydrillicola TaxID=1550245 RepID=UPI001ABB132C
MLIKRNLWGRRNKNTNTFVQNWRSFPFSYYVFLILLHLFSRIPNASAQSLNPITPTLPQLPQPNPLPPSTPPLEPSIIGPPTPEEVLNIPGKLTVQKFEFVGSTGFTQQELAKVTADFTGKPITFAQLLQAANKVTEFYIKKGCITSGAYIPSQEFRSGMIKIQVVEGSLEEIKVNVVKGRLNPDYVKRRIALATFKPFNINRLQQALQLLQRNPLIKSLSAELIAGSKPGTNSLEVTVKAERTFNAQFNFNNNRNPSVGSFERGIQLSDTNVLGLEDRLDFGYNNTDGSDRYEVNYTLPVNPRNGTVRFTSRINNNKIVEPPFNNLDIHVDSREFELSFRQPVIQKETPKVSKELALSLTGARREIDSSILGVGFPVFIGSSNSGKTRISELNFSQEWFQRSRRDVLAARSDFSFGLGVLGATINGNNQPDSRFFLWRGQLLYLRLLGDSRGNSLTSPTLLVRSNIQLASDPLLSINQFSLGGQSTVRGYRQDALLTDDGIFASAEVRLPIIQVPEVKGTLQFAPFFDFGSGWNINRNNPNPNILVGGGFGLVWQMEERFTARLDWGIPLVKVNSSHRTLQENGVYFQVQYNVFETR